jgi:hypothetical protein
VKCYNRKTKDSRFTKMEDSLLAEAVLVFVAPPVLPSVIMVPEPFGKITAIAPKVAQVPTSSADVNFLRRGFLKLSSSAVQGCPPPAPFGVISPPRSHTQKYEFGQSSEMVVSNEDGDFWGEEDGEFPYPFE